VVKLAESSKKSDVVVLRAPRAKGTLPVMRVVIGGMASRHALPVDRLDDVELAVETLFQEEPAEGGDLTLTVAIIEETFKVTLAGLRSPLVWRTLSGAPALDADRFGAQNILKMIMDSLVDGYRTADGTAPGSFAVEMEKRIL
jgi:hypothetical protein